MATGKGAPPSPLAESRQQLSEPEQGQGCKPVLLEKNCLGSEAAPVWGTQGVAHAELAVSTSAGKPRPGRPLPRKACKGKRPSTFMELSRPQERLGGDQAQDREHEVPAGHPGPQQLTPDVPRAPACCAWPGAARGEQRSAFSKPNKRPAERPVFQAALGDLSGLLHAVDVPCWSRLSVSKLVVGDLWNLQMVSQNTVLCRAFQGTPTLWLEPTQAPQGSPIPSASRSLPSRAVLSPTLASLGLSTQNWCARCSRSFRLTSDLVFHMRSHHKEPVGPDPHPKPRRQEALTCPVCHEYFRERHHLSRHMTSHS